MGISETKKQIVIDNYFKNTCDVNTSIKEAFAKGFEVGLTKAVFPKDQYEARLKADLEAMLEELYMEIEELDTPSDDSYDAGIVDCEKLIQEKINNLQVNNSKVKEQDDAEL